MANWTFSQYQIKTEAPPGALIAIPTFESWHQPWSLPRQMQDKIKPALAIALIASGLFAPVLTPTQITNGLESTYHQPWSEPVRFKQDPRATIALMASGLSAPVPADITYLGGNEASYHQPWSEPVRFKQDPRASIALIASGPFSPIFADTVSLGREMPWFAPLSEPKRFPRQLHASLQQFDPLQTPVQPKVTSFLQGWFNWLSEPVREKLGLKVYLQQTLAAPTRLLPTPNITAVMAATETNGDVFLGALNVYTGSVTPTTSGQGAKISVVENAVPGNDPVSIRES